MKSGLKVIPTRGALPGGAIHPARVIAAMQADKKTRGGHHGLCCLKIATAIRAASKLEEEMLVQVLRECAVAAVQPETRKGAANEFRIEAEFPERARGRSGRKEAAAHVREMFGRIAPRYDLLNHLLSLDIDKVWRRRCQAIQRNPAQSGRAYLIIRGTGDLALAFRKA
jgi:hypothetical protein